MFVPLVLSLLLKCQNALVGEDPWPYAEVHTQELLELYDADDQAMRKELEFREKAGMLSQLEIDELNYLRTKKR